MNIFCIFVIEKGKLLLVYEIIKNNLPFKYFFFILMYFVFALYKKKRKR